MKDPRRELRAYRKAATALKRKARRHNLRCHLCGEPFDWSLPYYDGMAFTADHLSPLGGGGHILGTLLPAHRSCNAKKGDGKRVSRTKTTRAW